MPPQLSTDGQGARLSRAGYWLIVLIAVAVGVRLIAITQPFVDHWSWRQSLLGMIAENFYSHGFNIFYPQVNYGGSSPGYVGTEFPLVPFLASLLYLVLGVHDWVGRAVSIAFFAASLPFLYLLVRKTANERSALFSVAIFSFIPLSVFASRSFMPDMATVSLSIAAVYLFSEWIEDTSRRALFVAATLVTVMAVLVKLPSGLIAIPFLYLAWRRQGFGVALKPEFWALGITCAVAAAAWYAHAYSIGTTEFPLEVWGAQHSPKSVTLAEFLGAARSVFGPGLTPLVSTAMLIGLFAPFSRDYRFLYHSWLAAVVFFWIVAGRGFVMHTWYGLPVVPVAAVLGGRACDAIATWLEQSTRSRLLRQCAVGVFFGALISLSYLSLSPRYRPWANPYRQAGLELRRVAPQDALVTFADTGDPTGIFYSGRKGCLFYAPADSDQAIRELQNLRSEGVQYLVFTRYARWWLDALPEFRTQLEAKHPRILATDAYTVFQLEPPEHALPRAGARAASGSNQQDEPGDERCGCTAYGFECRRIRAVEAPQSE